MPYVNIRIAGTLTREQKKQIAVEITDTLARIAHKPASYTKSLSVNNLALRYRPKAMDARREPPPNVIHCARLATPQTRFWAVTLRAGVDLSASLCREPLVVNDTTVRLASWAASQIDPGAGLNYSRTSSCIAFDELPDQNWAVGGKLLDEN